MPKLAYRFFWSFLAFGGTLAASPGPLQLTGSESFLCIAFGTSLLVLGATFGREKKAHSPRHSATSRSHTISKL
jgi:hypothetical protein